MKTKDKSIEEEEGRKEGGEGNKNGTLSSFDRPLWFLDNALNACVNKFPMRCHREERFLRISISPASFRPLYIETRVSNLNEL